ncbi:MAG TPA: hypothetical protein VGF88_04380 [Acidobacteriaceae bacterium]|jgi:hypothetical protein
MARLTIAFLTLVLLTHGCSQSTTLKPVHLRAGKPGTSPQILAVYEPWFGHPQHISVGYSSHDPAELHKQIRKAKSMGITGFVVDWYGDRDPFNARTYELLQPIAAEENFHIAMMYDETDSDDGATDEAIADFTTFRDSFLTPNAPGRQAYLTDDGHPMIFIFPKGGHTDWNRVREVVSQWNPTPLLIDESLPGANASAFDGFYAWVQPGQKGWAADGSNWGDDYLANFYSTMVSKYPDKITVGGAWSQFNDSKASWSLNRHISARCGKTFTDTENFWRRYFPADQPLAYMLIETWNDYEEGTAVEPGIPTCGSGSTQ